MEMRFYDDLSVHAFQLAFGLFLVCSGSFCFCFVFHGFDWLINLYTPSLP